MNFAPPPRQWARVLRIRAVPEGETLEARVERLDVSDLLSRQLDFGHLDGGAAAMANHLLNQKLHCNCQSKTVVSNRLKIDSCNAW